MKMLGKAIARTRRPISVLLAGGLLVFLGYRIVSEWQGLLQQGLQFRHDFLAASFLLLLLANLLQVAILQWVLRACGYTLTFSALFRLSSFANLGTYLPGRLWNYAGLAYLARLEGVPVSATTVAITVTMATSIVGGMLVSFTVVYQTVGSRALLPLCLVSIILLVVLHPRVSNRIFDRVPGERLKALNEVTLPFRSTVALVGCYVIDWLTLGVCIFFLVGSLYPVSFSELPRFFGIYAASWLVGYLTLLTPDGLGIREGVMSYLLSSHVPASIAAAVALLARLLAALIQFLCVGISMCLLRKHGTSQ